MQMILCSGSKGQETAFTIIEIKYVGGEGGYCRMLVVADPPDGKVGCIIVQYGLGYGFRFWEYPSIEGMLEAWASIFPPWPRIEKLAELGGCLRAVEPPHPRANPWFHAKDSSEVTNGDFFERT